MMLRELGAGTLPRSEPSDGQDSTDGKSLAILGQLAAFSGFYYVAYHLGMSFSQTMASPFWFPDSILLCALLLTRPARWWQFILLALPIRLFSEISGGIPFWFLLTTCAIDSLKGLLAALALRRLLRDPLRIESIKELALFALFAVLLIPVLAATAGAAAREALGFPFRVSWEQWFLGNALTHLVVTPAILYWAIGAPRIIRIRSRQTWIEGLTLTLALLLAGRIAFETAPASNGAVEQLSQFALMPLLFWAAIRFGMLGASGGIVLMTYFAVSSAINGTVPFANSLPNETIHELQQFLALRAPALYLVALLVQQKRTAESALRESEHRFRNLADTAPVLIWAAGVDGRLSFLNKGWLDFTRTEMVDQIGERWTHLVHPSEREHCDEIFERSFAQREAFSLECRLREGSGAFRWFVCTGTPELADDGTFVGFVGSCADVSAQKSAGAELQAIRSELAHVSRVTTMGEITASVAHELRQPLAAIMTNAETAEILLGSPSPPLADLKAILSDIRTDDRRAAEILGKMRSLLEKQEIARLPVDANDLVSEIGRLMRIEAAERRIAMHLELAVNLPPIIGDRVHLQQVLMNLILNGFDAMVDLPEARRSLVVRTQRKTTDHVSISVIDSGHGIPDEGMSKLFEPFSTTKKHGLGMGLSIARSIVIAHGGTLGAENRAGGGAVFTVSLPLALAERT